MRHRQPGSVLVPEEMNPSDRALYTEGAGIFDRVEGSRSGGLPGVAGAGAGPPLPGPDGQGDPFFRLYHEHICIRGLLGGEQGSGLGSRGLRFVASGGSASPLFVLVLDGAARATRPGASQSSAWRENATLGWIHGPAWSRPGAWRGPAHARSAAQE